MKKIYYKLNENDVETQTLYYDLPEYLNIGSEWLSTTGGDAITYDDIDTCAEGEEELLERIEKMIEENKDKDVEPCTEEDYQYVLGWAKTWGTYTPKKLWYAVQTEQEAENGEWGNGSFDWDEAVNMAKARGEDSRIAAIDGAYDEEGKEHADPICVAEYFNGEDF